MLTEKQTQLLREEKEALAEIRLALAGLDVPREELDTLQQATFQLDELFLLVIVGEFNAGKSALISALLGAKVLARCDPDDLAGHAGHGAQTAETFWTKALQVTTHPLALLRDQHRGTHLRHQRRHPPPRAPDR
jgi:ABC-type transport system involved in cytochrome bd biosynthesis fused ATPase/permease subunit